MSGASKRLVFEVTRDDLVAFNTWYLQHDPEHRRHLNLVRWGGAAALALLGLCAWWWLGRRPEALILVVAAAGGHLLMLRRHLDRLARRAVHRQLDGQDTRGLLCAHTLEITADGLREANDMHDNLVPWTAPFELRQAGEDRVMLSPEPGQVHVITRFRIQEGDVDAFLAEVRRRSAEARAALFTG